MNNADIVDLLDRLWEHFDRTADIDSDGTPNASLEFCASIDEAKKAIHQRSHDALGLMRVVAGYIEHWKGDVASNLMPLPSSLERGGEYTALAISALGGRK